jgi:hypothetical protein
LKSRVLQCGGRQWLLLRADLLDEDDVAFVGEGDHLMVLPLKPPLRETLARFTADFMPVNREPPDS